MRAGRHRDRRESPNSMRRPYTRAREHRSRHRRWSRRRPGARHRRELDHRCPLGARGGPRARRAPWLALAQGLGVRSRGRGGAAVDLGVERQEPLDEEEKSSSNRSSAWEAIGAARPLLSPGASWEPIACRRTPGPRLYEGGRVVNGAPAVGIRARGWVGGERRSCLYRPVGSRGLGVIGVLVRRCMSIVSRQAARRKGAPAGSEGLVAGEHVPD
jgi:hypothetical protein